MKKLTLLLLFTFTFSLFTSSQTITTIAGGGSVLGDGGPATAAMLVNPIGVCVDGIGNIFIGDYGANRVRKVNTSGIITTIAGTGTAGYNGDGIQGTAAELNGPCSLALDTLGNLYISELSGNRVRKLDTTTGIINTFAGTGAGGYSGDGVQATATDLSFPTGIGFDNIGNLYIADDINSRVRMVNTNGIISTIAGNGVYGYSGDGGLATAAEFEDPTALVIDVSGNLYIGDQVNYRVRVVNSSGIISTYAGNGMQGYYGDGGSATAAELDHPEEVALDASGNLYIDDEGNNVIRLVSPLGIISTIVGNSIGGFSGDGGPASAAELSGPQGVTLDNHGNIYIGDYGNSRVRKVTAVVTSLNNIKTENTISVYPNPAKNQLNIDLSGIKGEITLSIFNITGQEILSQTSEDVPMLQINTSALNEGIYIVRIRKESGTDFIQKVEIVK